MILALLLQTLAMSEAEVEALVGRLARPSPEQLVEDLNCVFHRTDSWAAIFDCLRTVGGEMDKINHRLDDVEGRSAAVRSSRPFQGRNAATLRRELDALSVRCMRLEVWLMAVSLIGFTGLVGLALAGYVFLPRKDKDAGKPGSDFA